MELIKAISIIIFTQSQTNRSKGLKRAKISVQNPKAQKAFFILLPSKKRFQLHNMHTHTSQNDDGRINKINNTYNLKIFETDSQYHYLFSAFNHISEAIQKAPGTITI